MTQTTLPPSKIMKAPAKRWKVWLGVVPFFLFAILFLFLPSLRLFEGSFTTDSGAFTFTNVLQLFEQPYILQAYWLSIQISAITALGGGVLGFLLAYSVTVGELPRPIRTVLITDNDGPVSYNEVRMMTGCKRIIQHDIRG